MPGRTGLYALVAIVLNARVALAGNTRYCVASCAPSLQTCRWRRMSSLAAKRESTIGQVRDPDRRVRSRPPRTPRLRAAPAFSLFATKCEDGINLILGRILEAAFLSPAG
jgi:hypothetical protein